MAAHVLVVATSHNRLGPVAESAASPASPAPTPGAEPAAGPADAGLTGVWAEELAAPWLRLAAAGCRLTLASVQGGPIPFDPKSLPRAGRDGDAAADSVRQFFADRTAMQAVQATPAIATVDIADADAILLPGGHGTMWDLPQSAALAERIRRLLGRGGIVAALCHGPAGLAGVRSADGRPLVAGRRLTAFTDSEEEKVGLARTVPFLLESRLRALGADVVAGPDFQPHAVRDGNLVTGQNPASSEAVADLLLQALAERGEQVRAAE
ncbi:type 1 glutamine amidotransferase domain-containing protein [Ferrovibrio sp.]|uniref:type 1 glutamine amidotransferase domain-containing protein n=1 Tax=Ferrovibrio sp. TaxID=1917215 RepID=UPI003516B0D1